MHLLQRQGSSTVFFIDFRWDLVVTEVDKARLVKMAAAPTIKDPYYPIITCARRYIQRCSELLFKGNMMVRRKLMSAGYLIPFP